MGPDCEKTELVHVSVHAGLCVPMNRGTFGVICLHVYHLVQDHMCLWECASVCVHACGKGDDQRRLAGELLPELQLNWALNSS